MPGVPYEMKAMDITVLPMLQEHFQPPSIVHRTILTTGLGESHLAHYRIAAWEDSLPVEGIKLAQALPSPGIVKLRLSTYAGQEAAEAQSRVDCKATELYGLVLNRSSEKARRSWSRWWVAG